MPRLIYFNYLGMFSKILDRDFRNSFTAITQSLHVYCGNYLFHLFKCYCLLLHRNLSNLISIFQQFFLISQERMVYRYTCDFLYLGIGQFDTNRSIFFYPIPQKEKTALLYNRLLRFQAPAQYPYLYHLL